MTESGKKKRKKRHTIGAFFVLVSFVYLSQQLSYSKQSNLNQLYAQKQSGVMVEFEAQVIRLLPDDNQGRQHQRFIVKNNDLTVLVTHNIDLAKSLPLKRGDELTILGQYEWNEHGGVVHWTHADPKGLHADGWIKFEGKTYGAQIKH